MEKNPNVKIIAEYGKYSFKQRLNRIESDKVLYSGKIQDAIRHGIDDILNIPREDLESLNNQKYKYIIITK